MIVRAAIVGVLTFTVEWVGITTDFPFGAYDYYPTLGFLVAGVPLTIAFAWVGVFLNSLFIKTTIEVETSRRNGYMDCTA